MRGGDAGEHGDRRRDRHARIDEALEPPDGLEPRQAHRPDLDDARLAGAGAGRLQVEDDVVGALERRVEERAGRVLPVGQDDLVARAPRKAGVGLDDLVDELAHERGRGAAKREQTGGGVGHREGPAGLGEAVVQAVAAVECQLGTVRSHTNTCSHTSRTVRLSLVLRIYASLPLRGPTGWAGRDILRGAELAVDRAGHADVELVTLDSAGADRDGRAAANARRAAEDAAAVAYLGDFHSSQVMRTAPVLGAAALLAVTPSATYSGL